MSTANDLEPLLKELNVQIRDALDTDLAGILRIYNDAVQNSTAIWNDRIVDLDNRRAWLAERHDQGYPVLVAIDEGGQVAGYASFGPWRPHDGFRHTVENSVYVSPDHRGSGIGRSHQRGVGGGKTLQRGVIQAGGQAGAGLGAEGGEAFDEAHCRSPETIGRTARKSTTRGKRARRVMARAFGLPFRC